VRSAAAAATADVVQREYDRLSSMVFFRFVVVVVFVFLLPRYAPAHATTPSRSAGTTKSQRRVGIEGTHKMPMLSA
jgi:hypothetical protein